MLLALMSRTDEEELALVLDAEHALDEEDEASPEVRAAQA